MHSGEGTGTTSKALVEFATTEGEMGHLFVGKKGTNSTWASYVDRAKKSRNKEIHKHFRNGI